MTDWWWAYLALGASAGFFSGLLGVGGGGPMVPVLAFIFAAMHFEQAHVVHLALGTAISTILFTSVSSVYSHYRHHAVNWRTALRLAPGIVAGTFGGALLAGHINVSMLSLIFAALIYYMATQMLLARKPKATHRLPGPGRLVLSACGIGLISSLTATGGAALVVTLLVKRDVRIHEAIGTAAAVGWPLAAAGASGYILSGMQVQGLPEYSLGYVYLPALAVIVLASMLMAPVGARIAHRSSSTTLKRIFAVLLYILATSMLLRFF